MSKSKKKNKGITIRGAYFIFWITTIISFIFTINTNGGGKISSPLIIIFLVNILAGIGLFIFLLLSKFTFEKPERNKFSLNAPILAAFYFSLYVTLMTLGGNGLIASEFRARVQEPKIENNAINLNVSSPTPADTPSPTEKPTTTIFVDSDPITDCVSSYPSCNGSSIRLRRSQCSNITCCQIGNNWSVYASTSKCKEDQANYNKVPTKYVYPTIGSLPNNSKTYYTCMLYYPALKTYQTYDHLYETKGECDAEQARLNQRSSPTVNTVIPTVMPTIDNTAQCDQIRQEWEGVKIQLSNQNYSSSFEEAENYIYWRDTYRGKLNSYKCSGTVN